MKSDEKIEFYNPNRLGDITFIFHKNHKKYLSDALSKYDLNTLQMLCLIKIYNEDNLCQKDISDGFYLTKGSITKAISKLEENDLIIRVKSPEDKRQYVLSITPKGKKLIPIIVNINRTWEKKMGLDQLSPEFIETFKKLALKSVELNK